MFMMPIIRPPNFPLNPLQDLKRMAREGKRTGISHLFFLLPLMRVGSQDLPLVSEGTAVLPV